MASNKSKKIKKAAADAVTSKVQKEHPFESDSQIQNRYGNGRKKAGSDGTTQDSRGSNH